MNNKVRIVDMKDAFKKSFAQNTREIEGLFQVTKHKKALLKHSDVNSSEMITISTLILKEQERRLINRHPN